MSVVKVTWSITCNDNKRTEITFVQADNIQEAILAVQSKRKPPEDSPCTWPKVISTELIEGADMIAKEYL